MSDAQITIPADLLPADGRFGSGPSKVRPAQVEALTANLISVNRRYKAHAGVRITDI